MKRLFGVDLESRFIQSEESRTWRIDYEERKKPAYLGLEWEDRTSECQQQNLTYSQHESRIQKAGYSRAPSAQEVMELVYAYYDRKLPDGMKNLAEDIFEKGTIFTSDAVKIGDGKMNIYKNVHGLSIINNCVYIPENERFYDKANMFFIMDVPAGEIEILNILDSSAPALFEHIFKRRYETLPDEMKKFPSEYYLPIGTSDNLFIIKINFRPFNIDFSGLQSNSIGVREK